MLSWGCLRTGALFSICDGFLSISNSGRLLSDLSCRGVQAAFDELLPETAAQQGALCAHSAWFVPVCMEGAAVHIQYRSRPAKRVRLRILAGRCLFAP